MNKKFFHAMREQMEPDKSVINSLYEKLNTKKKRAFNGQWTKRLVPVAACVVVLVAVLLAYPHWNFNLDESLMLNQSKSSDNSETGNEQANLHTSGNLSETQPDHEQTNPPSTNPVSSSPPSTKPSDNSTKPPTLENSKPTSETSNNPTNKPGGEDFPGHSSDALLEARDAADEYYFSKGKSRRDLVTCKPLCDTDVYKEYINSKKVKDELFAFAYWFITDPDPVDNPRAQPPHLIILTRATGGKWEVIFEGLW